MNAARSILAALLLGLAGILSANEPVDINTATPQMLAEALSGVGMHKAQAIVRHREEHGPFLSVDDLVQVSGIGAKTVERNRDVMTVGE